MVSSLHVSVNGRIISTNELINGDFISLPNLFLN